MSEPSRHTCPCPAAGITEAGQRDKAALVFRDVALNHKDAEAAQFPANLYLESLNVMFRHWKRTRSIEPMKHGTPIIFASNIRPWTSTVPTPMSVRADRFCDKARTQTKTQLGFARRFWRSTGQSTANCGSWAIILRHRAGFFPLR